MGIPNELHRLCGIDGDLLLKDMAQSMKDKYEKYWGDIENLKNLSASNHSNHILYTVPHT